MSDSGTRMRSGFVCMLIETSGCISRLRRPFVPEESSSFSSPDWYLYSDGAYSSAHQSTVRAGPAAVPVSQRENCDVRGLIAFCALPGSISIRVWHGRVRVYLCQSGSVSVRVRIRLYQSLAWQSKGPSLSESGSSLSESGSVRYTHRTVAARFHSC